MPPKQGAKAANAKATPAKAKAAAAAVKEPPATVTSSRGKEFETTAAAARPRRASTASVDTPAAAKVKKTAPAKKAAPKATKATTTSVAGKKRGRPTKAAAEDEEPELEAEPPKKRGRPANGTAAAPKTAAKAAPKKAAPKAKTTTKATTKASAKDAPAVSAKEEAPPKRRGRPPKGGETTQIEAADEAAAEQLEEELVENAAAEGPSKPTSSLKKKKGRPTKAKGRGKAAVTEEVAEEDAADEEDVDEAQATNGESVKQYWLMKAEQEDREETLSDGSVFNAKFTIDDLRSKSVPEPWDGVRNPTACKNMKEMNIGDLAFFYASGGKKGKAPGITGIMEIVKEAEADLSAFDENAPYYVKNPKQRGSEDKPRWFMVHVEFRKKLSKPVTLKELQKFAQGSGVLAEMQEFNTARLSVSKVTEKEWNFIVDNLIEGYEDEEALPTDEAGDTPSVDADGKAPNGIKKSIESDALTTDTGLTANTAPTSRPGSRAASSRAGSRAGSQSRTNGLKPPSRAASRAGSLQPPARPVSRGRSRTPGQRATSAQPTTMATVSEES